MKTKIFIIIAILMSAISLSVSLVGPSKTTNTTSSPNFIVNIYQNDDKSSAVVNKINQDNRNDYSIFFCKNDNWCKTVNQKDGSVGWVNLTQLKNAQEEYNKEMFQENTIKRLVAYQQAQDDKISQLQTTILKMQKNFGEVLSRQQMQINQLKQFVS